ncbi:MAG: hypothetical protein SVV03_06250 [Candidatus Nanohaloarchaea archaeon]|nr:hypothetical protein [Candidatus Nanohaloarchaea archaeon]
MSDYDRYQISVLTKLWRRNLFGGKYEPIEKLFSDIPKERRNEAKKGVEELRKDGLILYHKNGKCASIDTKHKSRVREILKGEVKDYILELR